MGSFLSSGSGDEILRHAVTGKTVGLARNSSLRKAVKMSVTEFVQDTGAVCAVLALDKTGQVTIESSGRLFVTAAGSGTLGSTKSQHEVHFASNTIPLVPRHEFLRDGHFVAGAYRYPTTPGQAVVITEGVIEMSSLGLHDFTKLFLFSRKAAEALTSHTSVRRCAMASDGKMIHLIPLHGLNDDWSPVIHAVEQFYPTYPGYLTPENAPKGSKDYLDNIQQRLIAVSGLREPFDTTYLGDTSDQNLFPRIIRGELEQWRIWESKTHIAFLTPFGNTPGFTVLIPRRHLSSDVFAVSEEDYKALIDATYIVAGIIKSAFGVTRVGIFFEGFEIDYAHVKLIPVHESGSPQTVVPPAALHTHYPGFITTQPGPREKDLTALDSVAKGAQQWLASQARIRVPSALVASSSALSRTKESGSDWHQGMLSIQDAVFTETVRFFSGELNYRFVLLPVTMNAISSPMGLGSDSMPVPIDLFGEKTYLADSMQFSLERMLRLDHGGGGVYYVAPSFRGEDHDATHLNQFFHVECELVGGMDAAISVAERYIITIIHQLLKKHALLISMFAGDTSHLQDILSLYAGHGDKLPRITLDEALALTMMPRNGWEYVQERPELGRRLTRKGEQALISHFGGALWVTEMDHLSIPFYLAYCDKGKGKALCADLLIGLGETLGLGQRHVLAEDVETALLKHCVDKGEETYGWYINLRRNEILQTSGWGLGLERFLAWLLRHDDIRDIPLIPVLKQRAH